MGILTAGFVSFGRTSCVTTWWWDRWLGGWVFVQFGAVQLDSTMGQLGGAGGVGRVRASIGSVIEVLVVLIGVFGESVFGCYGDVYMTQTAHNTNRINDRAATDCPTATG